MYHFPEAKNRFRQKTSRHLFHLKDIFNHIRLQIRPKSRAKAHFSETRGGWLSDLFRKAPFFQPRLDSVKITAVRDKCSCHGTPCTLRRQIADRPLYTAAAMRDERNDGLSGQIVFAQKRADRRRNRAPPVRRPHKNDIIARYVRDFVFQSGPVSVGDFLLRLIRQSTVNLGIRLSRLDFKKVSAGCRLNGFGGFSRISGSGIIRNQRFGFIGHIVSSILPGLRRNSGSQKNERNKERRQFFKHMFLLISKTEPHFFKTRNSILPAIRRLFPFFGRHLNVRNPDIFSHRRCLRYPCCLQANA